MSDKVLNNVPRELLERVSRDVTGREHWDALEPDAIAARQEIRALLSAQPQASADKSVHTEHCCKAHGCKYNDPACTVAYGDKVQSFPCEDCREDAQPQASAAQSAPAGLDFTIEDRGGCRVIVWSGDNGCRPASDAECAMWDAIAAWERAQSAPAGEREALQRLLDDVRDVRNADDVAFGWHEAIEQLGAAWQRTQSAPVVPEGWKLVPVEPTPEMAKVSTWDMNSFYSASKVWAAMLAAAPAQPAAQDQGEVQRLRRSAFRDHLEKCAAEVETWPEWKRSCMGQVLQPESVISQIDRHRIELLPEYGAGYVAKAYGEESEPIAEAAGFTATEAVQAVVAALAAHQGEGEQA